jgi:shikimate 5-dehydrogenase
MFSPEEIERYARHIVLHGVGGPGQQKLKAARVLVIGAGGLGSPLIQYLAAAGIGEIGVLDDDKVSLSKSSASGSARHDGYWPRQGRKRESGNRKIESTRQGHRVARTAHRG